jgi:hypothetical protein
MSISVRAIAAAAAGVVVMSSGIGDRHHVHVGRRPIVPGRHDEIAQRLTVGASLVDHDERSRRRHAIDQVLEHRRRLHVVGRRGPPEPARGGVAHAGGIEVRQESARRRGAHDHRAASYGRREHRLRVGRRRRTEDRRKTERRREVARGLDGGVGARELVEHAGLDRAEHDAEVVALETAEHVRLLERELRGLLARDVSADRTVEESAEHLRRAVRLRRGEEIGRIGLRTTRRDERRIAVAVRAAGEAEPEGRLALGARRALLDGRTDEAAGATPKGEERDDSGHGSS